MKSRIRGGTTSKQLVKHNSPKSLLLQFLNNISFRKFSNHIPSWGGEIKTINEDFENINKYQQKVFKLFNNLKIPNTCSIDFFYFHFGV
jgi:hypothetical protein